MEKFRSPSGRLYLRGLFLEESEDPSTVLYTLKDVDQGETPSLYRLFMKMADPTELKFARAYFESWDHWKKLQECEWFQPYLHRWREELEIDIRAQALQAIMDEAQSDSKNAFSANKFLVTGGWKEKSSEDGPSRGRGRPSKDEIAKAANQMVKESHKVLDDAKRLGMN